MVVYESEGVESSEVAGEVNRQEASATGGTTSCVAVGMLVSTAMFPGYSAAEDRVTLVQLCAARADTCIAVYTGRQGEVPCRKEQLSCLFVLLNELEPVPDSNCPCAAVVLQVIRSTSRWLFSAASLIGKGAKLLLLLSIELGAFPLAAGLWLDICALPLTASSLGQRGELLAKTPLIAGFMHWVLGVGFLLGFTLLACVVREVLRPGALPFLRDPTNPDRNPIREMLDEPLMRHLGKVAMSWVVYAGMKDRDHQPPPFSDMSVSLLLLCVRKFACTTYLCWYLQGGDVMGGL